MSRAPQIYEKFEKFAFVVIFIFNLKEVCAKVNLRAGSSFVIKETVGQSELSDLEASGTSRPLHTKQEIDTVTTDEDNAVHAFRGAFTENGALGANILWGPSIEIDK